MAHPANRYIQPITFIADYYHWANYQVPKKVHDKAHSISLHVHVTRWEELCFCLSAYDSSITIHMDVASFDKRIALNFSRDDGTWILGDVLYRGIPNEYKYNRIK